MLKQVQHDWRLGIRVSILSEWQKPLKFLLNANL